MMTLVMFSIIIVIARGSNGMANIYVELSRCWAWSKPRHTFIFSVNPHKKPMQEKLLLHPFGN